eukprot:6213859-Pleurochrysis_carterae.AAC.2
MILGNHRFPGGVAAWLPSLVMLVGNCKLANRAQQQTGGCGPVELDGAAQQHVSAGSMSSSGGSSRLEALMSRKYGSSIGKTLLLVRPRPSALLADITLWCVHDVRYCSPLVLKIALLHCAQLLRAYDRYAEWRKTLDLPTTEEESDRKRVALRMAIAAVRLTEIFDEVADGNSKIRMFHIISYILPRQVAMCAQHVISSSHSAFQRGNLWRFSTAKLESRGARCKHVVRRQTCARSRAAQTAAAGAGTAKTRAVIHKRGGSAVEKRAQIVVSGSTEYAQSYNSSQMQQLISFVALREQRALKKQSRGSAQLAAFGKLKKEDKFRSSVPAAFRGIVPDSHPFTCETVFESLLRKEFPLLYSLDGKCI